MTNTMNDDAADATPDVVKEDDRFELRRDGEVISFANFTEIDGVVTIPHVATNPAYRGKGNAARLMDGVLHQIREAGQTVVPLCPFAASHIRDHPQWHDLVEGT